MTVEYLSEGWNGEPIGSIDAVHLNRLKVAIERQPFPPQPAELVDYVNVLLTGEAVTESFRSFLEAWYNSPLSASINALSTNKVS